MAMSLLYRLGDMVKCVCYMGLEFNGYFMVDVVLTDGHYKIDIISGVGQLRLGSVMLLVTPQVRGRATESNCNIFLIK
jgi:hypothetical protein